MNETEAINLLLAAADYLEQQLMRAALAEDGARVAKLREALDAPPKVALVVSRVGDETKRRIVLQVAGTVRGEEVVAGLGALTVDVPPAPTAH